MTWNEDEAQIIPFVPYGVHFMSNGKAFEPRKQILLLITLQNRFRISFYYRFENNLCVIFLALAFGMQPPREREHALIVLLSGVSCDVMKCDLM